MIKTPFLDTNTTNFFYSRLRIGVGVGECIEEEMKKAREFVYIISPYISRDKIKMLEGLKAKVKLISMDEPAHARGIFSKQDWKGFRLYCLDFLKKKKKISSFFKKFFKLAFFIFLILLIYMLYYKLFLEYLSIIIFLFIIISLINLAFWYYTKNKNNEKDLLAYKLKYAKNMQKPKNIELKSIKSLYAHKGEGVQSPFVHAKLYIMDNPSLSKEKTELKIFLSSANLTNKGFSQNLEFSFESTDYKLCAWALKYFNELFDTKLDEYDFNELTSFLLARERMAKGF